MNRNTEFMIQLNKGFDLTMQCGHFRGKITGTVNLLNTANSNKNCISKNTTRSRSISAINELCFYLLTKLFDKIYSNIKAKYVLQHTFWSEVCIPTKNNDLTMTSQWLHNKEYIERRHGEPFKFLFLPKMGLLGSQAVLEKKSNSELWATFELDFFQFFMGKYTFFYIVVSALKSC